MLEQRHALSSALVIGACLLAPAAALAGLAMKTERIGDYWMLAELDQGNAQVTEVIDYDFGSSGRRGIFRTIPDLFPEPTLVSAADAGVVVSSATAPDKTQLTFDRIPRIRIGDPAITIRGRHRYRIQYPLSTLSSGDQFSWNAVGTEWQVGINDAEIHVVSANEFEDLLCDRGRFGSFGGCSVEQVEPGHLLVTANDLGSGVGLTVSARIGAPLAIAPAAPETPEDTALSGGLSVIFPMVLAFLAALSATPWITRLIRRSGREQIRDTTARSLGYIDDLETIDGQRLADEREMARLVYPSLNPPQGISAPQGGILLAEAVHDRHKVAWLLEASELGEITIKGDHTDPTLRRGTVRPRRVSQGIIDQLFKDSNEVDLGSYDSQFAGVWTRLENNLGAWRKRSGYWDPSGDVLHINTQIGGLVGTVLSALGVFLFSGLALRWSPFWLILLVPVAFALGSSVTAACRAWELRVRTPEGTAKWLEVEALRRFISELEPESALNMIEPDRFAGYTAWAVAFGYEDKWRRIAELAEKDPRFNHVPRSHFYIASVGHSMSIATSTASTKPSSSGGGGGFSGGVGGGGGGGGGGSW